MRVKVGCNLTFRVERVGGFAQADSGLVHFVEFEEAIKVFGGVSTNRYNKQSSSEWIECSGVTNGAFFGDSAQFSYNVVAGPRRGFVDENKHREDGGRRL